MVALLPVIGLAAAVYGLYDIVSHGPLLTSAFGLIHGLFYAYPTLARLFGIKIVRSDEFSTSRDETRLVISDFGPRMCGLDFTFGNKDHISSLKQRQRKSTRDLDIAPYFEELVGKRIDVAKLEDVIIEAWVHELIDCYEIPIEDRAGFASKIRIIRKFVPIFLDSPLSGFAYFFQNIGNFIAARSYWSGLDRAEVAIMMIPFLTTVDSSVFNFVTNPEPIKEFHELFQNVPVEYVPVRSNGRLVLVRIVANHANTPGNSVFGPQGMICPGNIVTSNLMKSVAQLKTQYQITVEGKPKQKEGLIRCVTNPTEVFVTFNLRSE